MSSLPSVLASALRALPAIVLMFGLAACASDRGPRRGSPADADAAAPAPTPSMEAHGMFFAGQVEVEVLLGRGGFAERDAAKAASGNDNSGASRGRSGGFGGGGGRRGGGRRGGGGGEAPPSRGNSATSEDGTPVLHISTSNLPPVRLQLRLTNHGAAPLEVEVPDFDSSLGNFVVQPPKILLLPDQPTEANPMISRLGVSSDEIALTVALQSDKKVEQQVLVLRVVKSAEPPPAGDSSTAAPATKP